MHENLSYDELRELVRLANEYVYDDLVSDGAFYRFLLCSSPDPDLEAPWPEGCDTPLM